MLRLVEVSPRHLLKSRGQFAATPPEIDEVNFWKRTTLWLHCAACSPYMLMYTGGLAVVKTFGKLNWASLSKIIYRQSIFLVVKLLFLRGQSLYKERISHFHNLVDLLYISRRSFFSLFFECIWMYVISRIPGDVMIQWQGSNQYAICVNSRENQCRLSTAFGMQWKNKKLKFDL